MKILVYHRMPQLTKLLKEGDDDFYKKEVFVKNDDIVRKVVNYHEKITEEDIVKDVGHNWVEQTNLLNILHKARIAKSKNEEREYNMIYCCDLLSLVHAPFTTALERLKEVNDIIPVKFVSYDLIQPYNALELLEIYNNYNSGRTSETNLLSAWRTTNEGRSTGRPRLQIDYDEAAKMKRGGMSYKEIASILGCSVALIYSKLDYKTRKYIKRGFAGKSTKEAIADLERRELEKNENK